MGTKGARGVGVTALFAGDSGTGKTMSAEVVAGTTVEELRSRLPRNPSMCRVAIPICSMLKVARSRFGMSNTKAGWEQGHCRLVFESEVTFRHN